jgi:hypothetical protein
VAAVLAAGALLCGVTGPARAQQGVGVPTITRLPPRVVVFVLPPDATVHQIAAVGLSPGLMSTGIGDVPAEQTYLDISQGNRVSDVLYDRPLPPLRDFLFRAPHWQHIVKRADSAPAEIVPGLLASSLLSRGIRSEAVPAAETAAVIAATRDGTVGVSNFGSLGVYSSGIGGVRKEATGMPSDELLIAFAEPVAGERTVPIGIAGNGFHGNLTSDSTRTDGYVLSTDIAPTILHHFGLPVPKEMDGEPIRAEGPVDPAAAQDRADRMTAIADRRIPVVVGCLGGWLLVAGTLALFAGGLRRSAAAWLAVTIAYLPLLLLAGAALRPSAVVEGLLVFLGAGALAALTIRMLRSWWAAAVACAITVVAYAIDVIAGSSLTTLSLLGPNPIFGARFYGIGNELEALFAVLVPVGVGAALSAKTGWGREVGIGAFLGAGAVAALVFAAGRFGADVGAAIVLPVGAVVAAAMLASFGRISTRSRQLLRVGGVIAAPVIAVALLALIDLGSGANAHLTRSVLDAGGAGSLADLAQRRLELSAHDFAQAAGNPLFWIVVVGLGVAIWRWRRIDAWLRPAPAARAGLIGACAAVGVGVLVNDSGASFLTLGAIALGASVTFAWSQASNP